MTTLTRPKQKMPEMVREALEKKGLKAAYDTRPPYQRNDYLSWIGRAKQAETKKKRLNTMLAELKAGHGYMGLEWKPRS